MNTRRSAPVSSVTAQLDYRKTVWTEIALDLKSHLEKQGLRWVARGNRKHHAASLTWNDFFSAVFFNL
jgi:hypothetical protein